MRKARKYLILDTETATLPFVNGMVKTVEQKRTLAIAKPLIYDIGWKIVDRNGKIYGEHSFLVSEIFCVPAIFDTAYYKDKKPIYLDRLEKNETQILSWYNITEILLQDLKEVDFVGAFNSMFDFKKAIPFTEQYMNSLYSPYYYRWEEQQKESCKRILEGNKYKNENWDGNNFEFRNEKYPLIDLWGISCEMLINTQTYKRKCLQHNMITESGQFFKSSAETTFRYLCQKFDFEELHMAIDDVNIECEILYKALKKGKITEGLQYFPFQMLGKTTFFILQESKKTIPIPEVEAVIKKITERLKTYEKESSYVTTLENELMRLIDYLDIRYNEEHDYHIMGVQLKIEKINKALLKIDNELEVLKSEKAIEKRILNREELVSEKMRLLSKLV